MWTTIGSKNLKEFKTDVIYGHNIDETFFKSPNWWTNLKKKIADVITLAYWLRGSEFDSRRNKYRTNKPELLQNGLVYKYFVFLTVKFVKISKKIKY